MSATIASTNAIDPSNSVSSLPATSMRGRILSAAGVNSFSELGWSRIDMDDSHTINELLATTSLYCAGPETSIYRVNSGTYLLLYADDVYYYAICVITGPSTFLCLAPGSGF